MSPKEPIEPHASEWQQYLIWDKINRGLFLLFEKNKKKINPLVLKLSH